MKVILTRDYEKLGNTGDIINVKDGFANNFLIPNNIAILATSGNIKQMELVKKSLILGAVLDGAVRSPSPASRRL